MRRGARGVLAVGVLAILVSPSRAQEPAAGDPEATPPDFTIGAPVDTIAVADSSDVLLFEPDPAAHALGRFRLERSVDVERIVFRDRNDPVEPRAMPTMADLLRLSPAVRTRELSWGPTVETYSLRGGGSGRSEFLYGNRTLAIPNTSGPQTNEVMMSEVAGCEIVRGGAAALFGPEAVSGTVILDPRLPITDEVLLSRLVAEEGVDDYQRGGFQVERRLGRGGTFFLSAESRRIEGFVPETKEVDRQFTGAIAGRVPGNIEATFRYRTYRGDGRFGGFGEDVGIVYTNRSEVYMDLFRPTGSGRGLLLQLGHLGAKIETFLAGEVVRDINSPYAKVTADLPDFAGLETVARAELTRWKIEVVEADSVDRFVRAAGALRTTKRFGERALATGTVRVDGEQDRTTGLQVRLEGQAVAGPATLFTVVSRNERFPDRGAEASDENEVHRSAEVGTSLAFPSIRVRLVAFATRIGDLRPGPTFAQVAARAPVLAAPVGDAEILGATVGFDTERFQVPGLRFMGHFLLRTSYTWMSTENVDTGEPLVGRPERTWTGEGILGRPFFKDNLDARVIGRLTHYGDRTNDMDCVPVDLWLTDVVLEGEIGDAVFFYRFHDLLEQGAQVEPCFPFAGFSRSYGISWRFVG